MLAPAFGGYPTIKDAAVHAEVEAHLDSSAVATAAMPSTRSRVTGAVRSVLRPVVRGAASVQVEGMWCVTGSGARQEAPRYPDPMRCEAVWKAAATDAD